MHAEELRRLYPRVFEKTLRLTRSLPDAEDAVHDAIERVLDGVFRVLADRTRRALLARLERSPAGITELADPFAMSLPAVSKHVRVLETAGLAMREVDGRVHRCSFDPAPLREADEWLAHYRGFWGETLDALADFVEVPDPRKRAPR